MEVFSFFHSVPFNFEILRFVFVQLVLKEKEYWFIEAED